MSITRTLTPEMQFTGVRAGQRPQVPLGLASGALRQQRSLAVQQQLLVQQHTRSRCASAGAAAVPRWDAALDDELSKRPLDLDAAGYFIIKVDREAGELVADFYTNFINEQGAAGVLRGSIRSSAVLPAGAALMHPQHSPTDGLHACTCPPAGLACDPATGEVISCKPGQVRLPTRTWRGRTAKALSVSRQRGFSC